MWYLSRITCEVVKQVKEIHIRVQIHQSAIVLVEQDQLALE